MYDTGNGKNLAIVQNRTPGRSALAFNAQQYKCGRSAAFQKLTLETPPQCSFFKTNAGNPVAVFVFQKKH